MKTTSLKLSKVSL